MNKIKQKHQQKRLHIPLFIRWLSFLTLITLGTLTALILHFTSILHFANGIIFGPFLWSILALIVINKKEPENYLPHSLKEKWDIKRYPRSRLNELRKEELKSISGFLQFVLLIGVFGVGLWIASIHCIESYIYSYDSSLLEAIFGKTCNIQSLMDITVIGGIFGLFMWAMGILDTVESKILKGIVYIPLFLLVFIEIFWYPIISVSVVKLFF